MTMLYVLCALLAVCSLANAVQADQLRKRVDSLSHALSALDERLEESYSELYRDNDQQRDMLARYSRVIAEHEQKLAQLTERVNEIPVEQMTANAQKEAAFLEGVQNIFDFSADSVPHLNLGGLTHE